MNNLGIIFFIALIALNIYVNIRLLVSPLFERFQKIVQSIIIWVLPVFGALLILHFIKDSDDDLPPSNKSFGGGDNTGMSGIGQG